MIQPKKLIEVALPIKEISAESVRDGRIQNGHISSLHKWWARRPLPVCRAVVFASLVPDPLDENCPKVFCDAVEILLGKENNAGDPYHPYEDIPYTAAVDRMEDNLRNRLLMFIGKFSKDYCNNLKIGLKTDSKDQLSDFSLIKWESRNNSTIINKARKLIWIAHNADSGTSFRNLILDFEAADFGIKEAESDLYFSTNRHNSTKEIKEKEGRLNNAVEAFLLKMPNVFDPFAGGGAIPLEAARLGCRSYGNDINPVAHIIQKGSLEFPQKFGKPIIFSKEEFIKLYGEDLWGIQPQDSKIVKNGEAVEVNITNRLAFDFEYYANKVLKNCESKIGYLFPNDEKGDKPIAYYWGRTGVCSNPSCKAEVPLLRQFYLCNKKDKHIYINPIINKNQINFEIKNGEYDFEGWISRGNLKCPCCGSITDVKLIKQQSINNKLGQRLLAVIYNGSKGKKYRTPTKDEEECIKNIPLDFVTPSESMQRNSAGGDTFSWGISKWGQLFSKRQLFCIDRLIAEINEIKAKNLLKKGEYEKSVILYLGIWLDRMVARMTQFGLIDIGRETIVDLFGRQAIPMVFDYPELYPFGIDQTSWIVKYIESESRNTFVTTCINASSGEKEQFPEKFISVVVTDPPYYDAIAYADLSDFFYVWLKRTLGDIFPLNFATPQTPKSEECTALKHHHNDNKEDAKKHFEDKLLQIFDSIEHQTLNIVSIMFAHQSTEAWSTLCNSILGAKMNITGSWANDTEMTGALKTDKAFLSSSVTVACKPSQRLGIGDYKNVRKAVEQTVAKEVEELYGLGFRGADLLTACFGQAVSEFGKYEKVEKADGSEVTVAELLNMARESAFNALLKGFVGDDFTKFYIGWLQLYGFIESEFGVLNNLVKVGLSVETNDLFKEHILIRNGNKQTLGTYQQRVQANSNIGDRTNNFLIDMVHRAMSLFKGNNRTVLLQYIGKVAAQPESSFWRVVTSLCEVLPSGCEDHKQALGLLTNKDSLIRESKTVQATVITQTNLFE